MIGSQNAATRTLYHTNYLVFQAQPLRCKEIGEHKPILAATSFTQLIDWFIKCTPYSYRATHFGPFRSRWRYTFLVSTTPSHHRWDRRELSTKQTPSWSRLSKVGKRKRRSLVELVAVAAVITSLMLTFASSNLFCAGPKPGQGDSRARRRKILAVLLNQFPMSS
jgi:hypothetical protein